MCDLALLALRILESDLMIKHQDCPSFPNLPEYVRLVAGASLTGMQV